MERKPAAEARIDVGHDELAVGLSEALHVGRADDAERLGHPAAELDQILILDRHALDRFAALRLDHCSGHGCQAAGVEVAEDVDGELRPEAGRLHHRVRGGVPEEELELDRIRGAVDVPRAEAASCLHEDGKRELTGQRRRQPGGRRADPLLHEELVGEVFVGAARDGLDTRDEHERSARSCSRASAST